MAESLPAAAQPARKKVTIPSLMDKMKRGDPIVQLAVYDYETAIIADRVGIDILCVSDTGGMVLFGHEDTTSVSFEEVMFMAQAVKRGSKYGLRMVDMPYMSFHLSAQQAVDNAAKYVSQGGAEVMKCEGNRAHGVHIIGSDLFHLYEKHTPRHSKIYADLVPIIEKGLSDYRDDVRARRYPAAEHTVFMKEDELAKFRQIVGKQRKTG